MKNSFKNFTLLILVSPFIFNSCKPNQNTTTNISDGNIYLEIGIIENGIPKITVNKEKLLNSWSSNLLKYSQIKTNFSDVTIEQSNGVFQLIFKNSKYKSSFYIKKVNSNKLFVAANAACTSSKCLNDKECEVKYEKNTPIFCTDCSDSDGCAKTSSSFAMLSF